MGELDVEEGLVELAVDMDMCAAVARSKHSNTDIAGAASDAMWWLVDSGASTHLINEETLQGVRVVSQSEHAGVDCVTATGASVGIRKSAVVQVEFRLGDPEGQTVLVELEVLVAPVRFNLLSLGRLLDRSWDVQFVPEFRVQAAKFSFLTRWKQNCGWLLSVPSVSSSASSVLGSKTAPCGDGSKEGHKQPVLSVDRGGGREGEPDSEQYRAGVGLRGRALRGTVTMSQQLEKIPLPKVAAKARPKGRPSAPKEKASSSNSPKVKAMPKKRVVLKPRKSAQMPWLLKYCAEARVTNVKRAVLKRCKAKTRAKHYAKPDERVTFNALEKAMDRKYAAYEPPKRSLWDRLECHRQACVTGVEAPRLVSFNPVEAWVEECNEGSSTIIIHGEKMMITTVSKTAEFGTSAAALAGTDKAFRYRIPEPPKVPARKRLPTPPRRPQGEAPMTPPRALRTSTTPRTPGTASKAPSPVAAVEIESHASWQYQDLD